MIAVTYDKNYIVAHFSNHTILPQVYKATDVRSKEVVAIKQLSLEGISEDALRSIMLEIDLLKTLQHANIVKYIGSFKTKTHLYIILEYMENGALSKVIRSSEFGAFPESLVAAYISQVDIHPEFTLHFLGLNYISCRHNCVVSQN